MNARLNLQGIRLLGLGWFLVCVSALPLAAAPSGSKISGVVVDAAGTPQMGATVLINSEAVFATPAWRLLTDERGHFSTPALPVGLYSVQVTLAGFLPAIKQHIRVDNAHAALLQIVMGSVFTSFEKLRRPTGEQVEADDWTWVLRASAATRAV